MYKIIYAAMVLGLAGCATPQERAAEDCTKMGVAPESMVECQLRLIPVYVMEDAAASAAGAGVLGSSMMSSAIMAPKPPITVYSYGR